jgi:ABC-type branched-subunit amino acid transport system substrate-binding protein
MMQRRSFLGAAAFAIAGGAQAQGVNRGEIVFGQTADFSASRSVITKAYAEGAALHFDQVNAQGGVNGRRIRIAQLDDAYDTARAVANARELVEHQQVFALVHSVGTGITGKLLPYVDERGVPHVHPLTGADEVRPPLRVSRETFFLRASYGREVERIVGQLHTLGIRGIALVHEDEPFGHAIRDAVLAAMKSRDSALAAIGVLPFNQPSAAAVAPAVAAVTRAQPAAVIVGSAGPSVEHFVRSYHARGGRAQFYCLSVSNVERLYKALDRLSQGIVVTQVMPPVQSSNLPVVRDYRAAVKQRSAAAGTFGLEGYISAQMIVQALRAAGREPTRAGFVQALASPALTHVGGFPVRYRSEPREGSPYVDLAIIGPGGKLVQ